MTIRNVGKNFRQTLGPTQPQRTFKLLTKDWNVVVNGTRYNLDPTCETFTYNGRGSTKIRVYELHDDHCRTLSSLIVRADASRSEVETSLVARFSPDCDYD